MKKTRIGIIGANPERGWASMAHIPALKSLPGYEISALSNRNAANTEILSKTFGVANIVAGSEELAKSPDVDMILVAIRVPLHFDAVRTAIENGKSVFSEWPLGKNLQETEKLTALAEEKNVKGYIGLQSRSVPAIRFIKDYIDQGNIGEVLSTSMIGSGIIYGEFTPKANDYTVDPVNGAGMINVTFGNAADALCYVLGEFSELNATTATRRATTTIVEDGDIIPMKIADQVAVTGKLLSGAVASIHFRGGMFPGTNFFWEINGTKGDIQISAAGGSLAVFEPEIRISAGLNGPMEPTPVPQSYNLVSDYGLDYIPASVGQNYMLIQSGEAPTFEDALLRHKMIDAVEKAARDGSSQSYL
ncbi:Gfo/Idh/MocA family oxidoreductase [Flavobacterium sp. MAH-1]|uniref:Gfo/Idh/MocA family oxidoreductase n=1 Tax=Flavobacterium agri TaxID=2743471 RepID=A0A7Y8Y0E2_9FLAO|nr:Gfo/Idh/MocA family oxidoreductase [Flavobacterium agri]NUY79618.1 Gfo/Idh/MocA family oxidoreductase [Flavobacterium agri]NYA69643.1 Gfo/Idh/MocA family oxidoreductase [Flavobacterium agri]